MRFYLRQDQGSSIAGGELAVFSVVFSPDGKTVAAGTSTGTVRLWDPGTGELRASLKGHTDAIHSMAFSPDGKTLVTGSADRTTKLWDVATGQERVTLKGHTNTVRAVAFAPDGMTLATGSADGTVKLWRAAGDKEAFAKRTELDPDDPHGPVAQNNRGDQLQIIGHPREAEAAYRQSISRLEKLLVHFPNSREYRQALGASYFS